MHSFPAPKILPYGAGVGPWGSDIDCRIESMRGSFIHTDVLFTHLAFLLSAIPQSSPPSILSAFKSMELLLP